ncbi:hypothetical protein BFP97_19050 [Roseivirga sp. 4D4]|nr:hypothetical protein BFP97_19050 [Roseivirga sp. 4D4]
MKNLTYLLAITATLSIHSCGDITLSDGPDPTEFEVDQLFEFPVSSTDGTGIIQLPLFFNGDSVSSFKVTNTPRGSIEAYSFKMSTDFNRPHHQFRLIKYVIPNETPPGTRLEDDVISIELTTLNGNIYRLGAKPIVADAFCDQGNNNFSLILKNYHYEVKKGQVNAFNIFNDITCQPGVTLSIASAGSYWVQLGNTPYNQSHPDHLDRAIAHGRSNYLANNNQLTGVWSELPDNHYGMIVPDNTPVGTNFQFAYAMFLPKRAHPNDPLYTFFDQYGFLGLTEWEIRLEYVQYGIMTFTVVD